MGLVCIGAACTPTPGQPLDVNREDMLAPSPTVLPFMPTEDANEFLGRSEPTSAALAAEGQPSEEANETEAYPTAQYVPLQIFAPDGTLLPVLFYGAAQRPAPLIMLLHDSNQDGDVWISTAPQFQQAGYNVLVTDLRGRRQDPATVDWSVLVEDIQTLIANVQGMAGISTERVLTMGLGTGATLALALCAETIGCSDTVAISPYAEATGLDMRNLVGQLGNRAVLLVSADDDDLATTGAERFAALLGGAATWQRYTSGGHGDELLRGQPELLTYIVQWLAQ